ncbi:flavo protein [Pluteus cervinus]|uniref:Flavo protein n=1 Tax=Pluteus cervinus TaxID=181527 RepID=A0ACD3B598_9AGAR|nr:flavo protein [Pluteus cervinus]
MTLQTIAVLDDSELQDGQMKEVDFNQGKVLLSKVDNKVYATSAYCTHYGAPLVKGIITADARVVCPWHGACFNVCSGDIEDAPAPMALHSFKASVESGKIYVTANLSDTLKENRERPPKLLSSGFETICKGVVIVGGGSGAFYAVESLRECRYKGPITILSKENYTPIDRTKLSKALVTDPTKLEWKTAADLKIKYGTNIRLGTIVTSVDLEKRQVSLDGGKDIVPYDKLILAPGGIPRRLPVEGANFENVFTLRDVEDAAKIDQAAQEGKRLVVAGSSFISMELVAAVSKRKLASIDVIGMEEYPFEVILGKEVGQGLKKYHESQGVRFHMSSKVEKILPQEGSTTLAGGVVVNGVTLPADFVVMGVGVAPATEFLKGSGIELERDGSVKVNEYLRVTSGPDLRNVYAIGDIASYPQAVTGQHVRIEHWNVAGNHGRAVGKTIAGSPQPFVKVPVFWSAQGQQLRYCGLGHGYDDVIITGDPGEMKFIAYYVKENKIIAVASMQNDPVVSKASELLRLGLMPSPNEVRSGKDLLSIDISSSRSLRRVGA